MAKLYFSYSAVNAGKSTSLLQVAYNYRERDMEVLVLNSALDTRDGEGVVQSRAGISTAATLYRNDDNLYDLTSEYLTQHTIAAVLVDEAQFLTIDQVNQLAHVVDELHIPVLCYGLRTDFLGQLFPGSERLLAVADELREIRTICHCGHKATMTRRVDAAGVVLDDGPQTQIGGTDMYIPLCRKHWMAKEIVAKK